MGDMVKKTAKRKKSMKGEQRKDYRQSGGGHSKFGGLLSVLKG